MFKLGEQTEEIRLRGVRDRLQGEFTPMNKYLSAALAASLMAMPSLSRADTAFTNDQDKVSYSIGVDFGRNLSKQGIDVNNDVLTQGIKDGLAGGPLKMTDDEMQATMTAFVQVMHDKAQEKEKEAATVNKAKGEAYLEANKKKDGWKVTSDGLQYKILTTGTGPTPKATDNVVTNYRGTFIDGTEFDSSYKRNEPAEFPVNKVIPGWTEALQMMPVGSKWQLAIPSNLAYGEDAPPQIGPNSTLLFDIELLSIKPPDASGSPTPQ
jgi:FKBP-type peptidyl-prolyl cis-trans isomerase FklB